MKYALIFLCFTVLVALAVIKIGSNANWAVLFPQEEAELTNNDTQSFQEWSEELDRKIENGVILSE